MTKDSKEMREMQNVFIELADITGNMADMIDREADGEEINQKELESLIGAYMYKIIELQSLSNNM
ncbi:hypothetical protein [Clostridium paraputrificum]|jgi:hypothetical protein|uniref:hypothetical protein n=1 Tax=Clostridium paraputrificum TaxID=29363 RepID=UPI000C06D330|nr:hypothetical protein [Clostridium paraputrificum]